MLCSVGGSFAFNENGHQVWIKQAAGVYRKCTITVTKEWMNTALARGLLYPEYTLDLDTGQASWQGTVFLLSLPDCADTRFTTGTGPDPGDPKIGRQTLPVLTTLTSQGVYTVIQARLPGQTVPLIQVRCYVHFESP